jgi:hypothetical protein
MTVDGKTTDSQNLDDCLQEGRCWPGIAVGSKQAERKGCLTFLGLVEIQSLHCHPFDRWQARFAATTWCCGRGDLLFGVPAQQQIPRSARSDWRSGSQLRGGARDDSRWEDYRFSKSGRLAILSLDDCFKRKGRYWLGIAVGSKQSPQCGRMITLRQSASAIMRILWPTARTNAAQPRARSGFAIT